MRRSPEGFDIVTQAITTLNAHMTADIDPEQHFQFRHIFKRLENDLRSPAVVSKATAASDKALRMLLPIPKRQVGF